MAFVALWILADNRGGRARHDDLLGPAFGRERIYEVHGCGLIGGYLLLHVLVFQILLFDERAGSVDHVIKIMLLYLLI